MSMRITTFLFLIAMGCVFTNRCRADVLVQKYLSSGELAKGETELKQHLQTNPKDDEARFGLGMLQALQAVQKFSNNLSKSGFLSSRLYYSRPRTDEEKEVREVFREPAEPERLTYAGLRKIVRTFVDDISAAETTLAEVTDSKVRLPIETGKVKLTPFSGDKQITTGTLGAAFRNPFVERVIGKEAVIIFDRGDASWLRGYCNALAGAGELFLAFDTRDMFVVMAPRYFKNPERPTLKQNPFPVNQAPNFPVYDAKRLTKALKHFETTLALSKDMWRHYQAETDDDHEWIPNPRQTGVFGVPITQQQMQVWIQVVTEAEQVLQGKKLLPYWVRRNNNNQGINLRKIFTNPQPISMVLWMQGNGPQTYLENGVVTNFGDQQRYNQIQEVYNGQMVRFGFWTN